MPRRKARPTAGPTPTASSNWTSAGSSARPCWPAYKLTGNPRYLAAVPHWADLLAEHCDLRPGVGAWNRYANPKDCTWDTQETAGMSLTLQFLNDVIQTGLPRQGRRPGEGPRRRRKILPQRLAARVEPRSDVRPSLLGLGQPHLHLRGAQLHGPIHDGPPRGLPAVEKRHPQFLVAVPLPTRASIRVRRATCTPARGPFPRRATAAASRCNIRPCTWRPRGAATRRWPTTPGPARSPAGESILTTYDARETGVVEDRIDGGVMVIGAGVGIMDRCSTWPIPGRCGPPWKCSPGSRRRSARPARTTSCAAVRWSARFATARAGSPIPPSMPCRPARTCCGWPLRPRRFRPTAGPCRFGRTRRKTASRSSRCLAATSS